MEITNLYSSFTAIIMIWLLGISSSEAYPCLIGNLSSACDKIEMRCNQIIIPSTTGIIMCFAEGIDCTSECQTQPCAGMASIVDDDSLCICQKYQKVQECKYKVNDQFVDHPALFKLPVQASQNHNAKRQVQRTREIKQVACSLKQQSLSVILTTDTDATCISTISMQNWYLAVQFQKQTTATPAIEARSLGGKITAIVYCNSISTSCETDYTAIQECIIPDCLICWDVFTSFACLPSTGKYLLIALIVGATIVILKFAAPIIFFIIACVFSCTKYGKKLYGKFKFNLKKKQDKLDKILEQQEMILKNNGYYQMPSEIPLNNVDTKSLLKGDIESRPIEAFVPTFERRLVSSLLVGAGVASKVALSCTVTNVISNDILLCSYNGTAICNITTNVNFILPVPGSSVCLRFEVPGTQETEVEIKWATMEFNAIMETIYETTDYDGLLSVKRWCAGEGKCTDNTAGINKCAAVEPFDQNPYNIFDEDDIRFKTGFSSCYRGSGCSWNGCGSCDGSCVFSKWAINPKGPPFQVKKVRQMIPKFTFLTSGFAGINGSDDKSASTGATTWTLNSMVTAGFVGSFAYTLPVFDRSIVANQAESFLCYVADINVPQANKIGDVQQLGTVTRVAPDLLTAEEQDETVIANWNTPAITNRKTICIELPSQFGSLYLRGGYDTLTGTPANPASIQLNLRFNKAVVLEIKRTTVCPVAKLISVTGCYSCSLGFRIKIIAHSSCAEGTVDIITNLNLLASMVRLEQLSTTIELVGFSDHPSLSGSFYLESEGVKSDELLITATLQRINYLVNGTTTQQVGNNTAPLDGGIFDFGFGPTWNSVISGLIWACIAIVGIVITYFGIKFFTQRYGHKIKILMTKKTV